MAQGGGGGGGSTAFVGAASNTLAGLDTTGVPSVTFTYKPKKKSLDQINAENVLRLALNPVQSMLLK
jgi:hypothetical protein